MQESLDILRMQTRTLESDTWFFESAVVYYKKLVNGFEIEARN
jgi:hypothetical protein